MPDVANLPPLAGVKDPNVRAALEAIYSQLRIRNGEVGSGKAKFMTETDTRTLLNQQYGLNPTKGAA